MKNAITVKIGTIFGSNSQLEIIDLILDRTRKRHGTRCLVKCHICCMDEELFGEGIFLQNKSDTKKGKHPCACSGRYKYSEEQWRVRLRRTAEEKKYLFIGFAEPFTNQNTRTMIYCEKHQHLWNPDINNFINSGRGCPICAGDMRSIKKKKPDEIMISSFLKTGSYVKGTRFWRKSSRGRVWCYYCPMCSNDEYVKEGICSGVFESDKANLQSGKLVCRCSSQHRWTQAEREYQITKIIKDNNLPIIFSGWKDIKGYKNNESRIIIKDSYGNYYDKSVSGFVYNKQWFLSNRDNDPLRKSWIYVLAAKSRYSEFTGYGISANIEQRTKEHVKQLEKYGFYIDEMFVVETDWKTASEIELSIKHCFKNSPQEVIGFKTEATDYYNLGDVINHIEELVNKQMISKIIRKVSA